MKNRSVLFVIDMVNGFLKEGELSDIRINRITPNIIKLIKEHGGEIVFVRDSHKLDCEEFKYYPVHCLEGTCESELVDELKPFERMGRTFLKNTTNIMNEELFIKYLEENPDIYEYIFTGCLTEICVKNAIYGLIDYLNKNNRKGSIIVPEDCVDTFDSPIHNRDLINEETLNEFENNERILVKRMERR